MKLAALALAALLPSLAAAENATVSWEMTNTTGVGGYEIGVGTAPGVYTTPYQDVAGAASRSATITGLQPGNKYYVSVRARNAAKTVWSAWATEATTTIHLPTPGAVTVTVVVTVGSN